MLQAKAEIDILVKERVSEGPPVFAYPGLTPTLKLRCTSPALSSEALAKEDRQATPGTASHL